MKVKKINENRYFLRYQREWLRDESPVKIWEKSRRIGATYVQSYEDVRDCVLGHFPAVWFSSADDTAAKEYIRYCLQWAEIFDAVVNEGVIKKRNGQNAYCINFFNGSRITALSSNPKSFRSKGGKVCLDEFAHHQHQQELWKAARPVITWGYPVRILSTHNGKLNLFYSFIEKIRCGELNWSIHRTDINDALKDGLLEKIFGRKVKQGEQFKWLEGLRTDCADEYSWQEEYLCIPVDESTAFIPLDLIRRCTGNQNRQKIRDTEPLCAAGIDVGRNHDMTVVWVLEKEEDYFYSIDVRQLRYMTFREQRWEIEKIINANNVISVCIDTTGLGMQLGEELSEKFGEKMVERFVFTSKSKSEIAYQIKSVMQEGRISIPDEKEIVESLHSVTITHTGAGALSIGASRNENGHADHFWALALALRAAGRAGGAEIKPRTVRYRLDTRYKT